MSLRVNGQHPGIGSSQQVNPTPQVEDPSVQGTEGVGKKKASKKGIADFNDAFEASPQGAQHPQQPTHLPAVQQPQQSEQTKANAAEGSSNKSVHFNSGLENVTREHLDENGYKWTSWRFEPPTVKNSEGIDKDFAKEALDKLAEMWKDAADKAQFSNIRA